MGKGKRGKDGHHVDLQAQIRIMRALKSFCYETLEFTGMAGVGSL